MKEIHRIPGIRDKARELLEACGYDVAERLGQANAEDLHQLAKKANKELHIYAKAPRLTDVKRWIEYAKLYLATMEEEEKGLEEEEGGQDRREARVALSQGDHEAGEKTVGEVKIANYENMIEVQRLLAVAPLAVPLSKNALMKHGLSVGEIGEGLMLNAYPGDLDMRVEKRFPARKKQGDVKVSRIGRGEKVKEIGDEEQPRATRMVEEEAVVSLGEVKNENGATRMPRFGEHKVERVVSLPTMITANEDERLRLIRSPRESTNRGKNPESRWYIRGVLHPSPMSIYGSAITTLLFWGGLISTVVATVLLVLLKEQGDHYPWIPEWIVWVPLALPVTGLLYLMVAVNTRCRICGQKLFMHQRHLKNRKAHYRKFLGYVLPLCFHLLIFRWFRCSHCGTPIRLKE